MSFFKDQTVFLTGGTGFLGSCLLSQLVLLLPTRKVYVLIRRLEEEARKTWNKTIPIQIKSILDSGRVRLVLGDIMKPNFGITSVILSQISSHTSIIIHAVSSRLWKVLQSANQS